MLPSNLFLTNGLSSNRADSQVCLSVSDLEINLLSNYVEGGNSYDSIGFITLKLILASHIQLSSESSSTGPSVSSERQHRDAGCSAISDLLIAKVVQQKGWGTCVEQFNLVGRKQAEVQLRQDISFLLSNLQCK